MSTSARRQFVTGAAAALASGTILSGPPESCGQEIKLPDPRRIIGGKPEEILQPLNLPELVPQLVSQLVDVLLGGGLKDALSKFNEYPKRLEDIKLGELPGALHTSPLQALTALSAFGRFVKLIGQRDLIDARLLAVRNSLKALLRVTTGGQVDEELNLLSHPIDASITLIRDCLDGKLPERALQSFLFESFRPEKLFTAMIEGISKKSKTFWNKWIELPNGMGPGQLHDWLFDMRVTYYDFETAVGGIPVWTEEREIRCRLANALAHFLEEKAASTEFQEQVMQAVKRGHVDERMSYELLADLIVVIVGTVIRFIFEPANRTVTANEGQHAVVERFAEVYSRQLLASARITLATSLRGIWVWSVRNENLMELIGTVIGAVFAGIIDGVVRNIGWQFDVVVDCSISLPEVPEPIYSTTIRYYEPKALVGGGIGKEERKILFAFLASTRSDALGEVAGQLRGFGHDNPSFGRLLDDLAAFVFLSQRTEAAGDEALASHFFGTTDPDVVALPTIQVLPVSCGGRSVSWWKIRTTVRKPGAWPNPLLWCHHSLGVTPMFPSDDDEYVGLVWAWYPRNSAPDVLSVKSTGGGMSAKQGGSAIQIEKGRDAYYSRALKAGLITQNMYLRNFGKFWAARIVSIDQDSPLRTLNLAEGDVITRLDGERIAEVRHYLQGDAYELPEAESHFGTTTVTYIKAGTARVLEGDIELRTIAP